MYFSSYTAPIELLEKLDYEDLLNSMDYIWDVIVKHAGIDFEKMYSPHLKISEALILHKYHGNDRVLPIKFIISGVKQGSMTYDLRRYVKLKSAAPAFQEEIVY